MQTCFVGVESADSISSARKKSTLTSGFYRTRRKPYTRFAGFGDCRNLIHVREPFIEPGVVEWVEVRNGAERSVIQEVYEETYKSKKTAESIENTDFLAKSIKRADREYGDLGALVKCSASVLGVDSWASTVKNPGKGKRLFAVSANGMIYKSSKWYDIVKWIDGNFHKKENPDPSLAGVFDIVEMRVFDEGRHAGTVSVRIRVRVKVHYTFVREPGDQEGEFLGWFFYGKPRRDAV